MERYGLIYEYSGAATVRSHRPKHQQGNWFRRLGAGIVAVALGGMVGPLVPAMRLEASYYMRGLTTAVTAQSNPPKPLPKAVPVIFNPLLTEDGGSIDPINTEFSLIVPKIGINAAVIPAVNPADPKEYKDALQKGVAHASTSYFPNEDGTVYLFSHSTNYDWFVKDLNAVFYLLKNLDQGDLIVVFYKGQRYTYKLTEKRIVAPSDISYLVPNPGKKSLILQTCWPPGSTTERLLIFADLVEEAGQSI